MTQTAEEANQVHPSEGAFAGEKPARRRSGIRGLSVKGLLEQFGVGILLVVLIAFFSIYLPHSFPTHGNVVTMISSQDILVVLTLAVLMPLRAGDFDLSIAATMIVSAATIARLTSGGNHLPIVVAAAIGIAIGAAIGLLNGVLVVSLGLDGFVATLGVMTALEGVGYAISGNQVLPSIASGYITFSTKHFGGLPLAAYYGWFLALCCWFLYRYRPFGRQLLFVGGARESAQLVGINVKKVRMSAYVFSGAMAAFAGVILMGTLGSVDPSTGPNYLLTPYAAAFLGAAAIDIGRFNVVGALLALYLIVVGTTGLELSGAPNWISYVFNGGALIVALATGRLIRIAGLRRGSRAAASQVRG